MNKYFVFILLNVLSCLIVQAKDYTPNDVYSEALLLEQNIKQWRSKEDKSDVWVQVAVENNYYPRHVFIKAIEILEKINSYRVNVIKVGSIPVNYPGGRAITPNEVYNEVHRARQELLAMLKNINIVIEDTAVKQKITGKTPNDVYAKLKEISLALDGSLGLRGISPTDVYIASQQIVSLAKFLRRSQNLPIYIPTIVRAKNKRPNHALAAVQALTIKINAIEKNLSMEPVRVIDVPKRVISPSDVYNAMGIVFAELQRIQYHLGLERYFPKELPQTTKTFDAVIFNTNLAQDLLPNFSDKTKLQQYDANLLIKKPNDVFSITHHILSELYKYCRFKGIKIPTYSLPKVKKLTPQHVFTQGLEALEMIVKLRENQGMGLSATPNYPLKEITPQEVFDLSLRVDEYLSIVFKESEMVSSTWITSDDIEYFNDKTSNDVYINMWKITSTLKAILNNQGFSSNDLFQKTDYLEKKVDIITLYLSSKSAVEIGQFDINKPSHNLQSHEPKTIENKDILNKVFNLKKLIKKIKTQQGLSTKASILLPRISEVKTSDISSELWRFDAGLSEIELFLGIYKKAEKTIEAKDKSRMDVYQKLLTLEEKLHMLSRYLPIINAKGHE